MVCKLSPRRYPYFDVVVGLDGFNDDGELVTDRKKMEGYCSTGQSPQWAVVPVEEEEEEEEEEEKEEEEWSVNLEAVFTRVLWI
jgi:hypothetical protein